MSKAFQSSSEKLGNKNKGKQQFSFLMKVGLVLKVESRGCHEKRRWTFFKPLQSQTIADFLVVLHYLMWNYYTGHFSCNLSSTLRARAPQREKSGNRTFRQNSWPATHQVGFRFADMTEFTMAPLTPFSSIMCVPCFLFLASLQFWEMFTSHLGCVCPVVESAITAVNDQEKNPWIRGL